MSQSTPDLVELLFVLDQDEDGWPPAAVEGLWCQEVDDGAYRLATCPLFVKGLSVGDIIRVTPNANGEVEVFVVAQPSTRTTMWLIIDDQAEREQALSALHDLGCNTTGGPQHVPSLSAVDIPSDLSFSQIDAVVAPLEADGKAAAAYPSFRHPDG